jgi:hypothetical protein
MQRHRNPRASLPKRPIHDNQHAPTLTAGTVADTRAVTP